MRPRTSRPAPRNDDTRAGTSDGAQPLRPGTVVVSTSTSTATPGACRGDGLALRHPAQGLPARHHRSEHAHTPALDGTEIVPTSGRLAGVTGTARRVGRAVGCDPVRVRVRVHVRRNLSQRRDLGQQLVGVVLPDVIEPGAARRVDCARPEPLGDRDDAHTGRIPPGVLDTSSQRDDTCRHDIGGRGRGQHAFQRGRHGSRWGDATRAAPGAPRHRGRGGRSTPPCTSCTAGFDRQGRSGA